MRLLNIVQGMLARCLDIRNIRTNIADSLLLAFLCGSFIAVHTLPGR